MITLIGSTLSGTINIYIMDNFQQKLTERVIRFRNERNWEQFHTSKDIAINLSVEANELLQLFLWKTNEQPDRDKLSDEVGDVLYALLLICERFQIDLATAFENKMQQNEAKYPVNEYYNSNRKYNEGGQ